MADTDIKGLVKGLADGAPVMQIANGLSRLGQTIQDTSRKAVATSRRYKDRAVAAVRSATRGR